MAVAAAAVWEFRSTATAGNVNGGFFVPGGGGVDYSQQDTAQYGFTDLATSNGTNATPTVSSASHSFVANDVGNAIAIIAGTNWTKGFYQIVSVSAGNAVLDRAVGSSASLSGGTYNVGGAISLGASGAGSTIVDTTVASTIQPGNRIWFKSSNNLAATFTVTNGTAGTAPVIWEGYQTTRGDAPTGTNRPTLNCAGFTGNNGGGNILRHMIMTGTNTNTFTVGSASLVYNCKFVNTSATATRVACNGAGNARFIFCEMISIRGTACTGGSGAIFDNCIIHSSDKGISTTTNVGVIKNCIVFGCVTAAIEFLSSGGAPIVILNNTLIGSITPIGAGLSIASGWTAAYVNNNIIYGFTNGLIDSSTVAFGGNNCFFNNTSDSTTWGGTNDIFADPDFVDLVVMTGTGASTSASTLTDGAANFTNIVDGLHYLRIISGSGVTVGIYPIVTHTTTTIVATGLTMGTGTGVAYEIFLVGNLNIGADLQGEANPTNWQISSTTNFADIGAAQRDPSNDYTDPGASNVKDGVSYLFEGSTENGTYDGSDRWTDPGVDNVRSATAYKANSLSNNRTGNLVVPTDSQVKIGVTFETSNGDTGTYDGSDRWTDPGEANVRDGTTYKANSLTENQEGTLDLPDVTDVKIEVEYDGETKIGEYDGSDRWTDPLSINVKEGVEYKANATVNNRVGSFVATPLPQKIDHNLGVNPTTRMLSGALYIIRDNNVIVDDLGPASYELLNPDGVAIGGGIGETDLEADENGLYFITPVDLTALDQWPNYMLVITIEARSVEYSQPFKFAIEMLSGGGGGGDCPTAEEVADAVWASEDVPEIPTAAAISDAVWDESVSDHTGEGTTGGFLSRIDDIETKIDAIDIPTPAENADAVWDEAVIDHDTAGTFGETNQTAGGGGGATPEEIADAVWDEAATDHNGSGSFGEILNEAGTGEGPTASSIATAVWSKPTEESTASGTFGGLVQKLLTTAKFLGLK